MEERNCRNCRYFFAHYIKSMRGYFYKMPTDGHCVCDKIKLVTREKIIRRNLNCDYWEPLARQTDERKENIVAHIRRIERYLSDVRLVLSDDYGCPSLPVYEEDKIL